MPNPTDPAADTGSPQADVIEAADERAAKDRRRAYAYMSVEAHVLECKNMGRLVLEAFDTAACASVGYPNYFELADGEILHFAVGHLVGMINDLHAAYFAADED